MFEETMSTDPLSLPARILVVEDEPSVVSVLKTVLAREGVQVDVATDGVEAQRMAMEQQPDLVILDLGLPLKDGLDVLRDWRASGFAAPVIILSARDKTEDRIRGLEHGADDYIVKPFDHRELAARVHSVWQRSQGLRGRYLEGAGFRLDIMTRTVTHEGEAVVLTPKESVLLEYFLRRKNILIKREQLLQDLWGLNFDPQTNVVDVAVSRLRKATGMDASGGPLKTVQGEGFILADTP
jgi:DNA-binding response OmpR family regulator